MYDHLMSTRIFTLTWKIYIPMSLETCEESGYGLHVSLLNRVCYTLGEVAWSRKPTI